MRIAIVTAVSASVLTAATGLAADYPVLRGSYAPPAKPFEAEQVLWNGFYFGGFAGYASGQFGNFTGSTPNSLMNGFYTGSSVPPLFQQSGFFDLPFGSSREATFGGFVGYNMVFGDAMVGVEADYTALNMSYTSSQSFTTFDIVAPGVGYTQLTGSSTSKLDGYATFRGRAGWAYGSFLPFITGGLAVGRGSYNSNLSMIYSATAAAPPTSDGSLSRTISRRDAYVVGGTIGAGVDVLLASNILLRAEYQYVAFNGNSIPLTINTVRVGAGLKF
ncbi:MAG: outer membrane beta-barrel protein [Beijerinckiaceae bacterium]